MVGKMQRDSGILTDSSSIHQAVINIYKEVIKFITVKVSPYEFSNIVGQKVNEESKVKEP
jgi:hypothetical protein